MSERLIEFVMCGSAGEKCNPYELTSPVERQKLLLLINTRPLSIEDIAKRLGLTVEEVANNLKELLRCGLVEKEKEDETYRPAIAIFTIEDQKMLMPLINELVSDTVEAVKHWLPKIRETLNSITVVRRGLRFPDLEYIVVGALALDYEGLEVLSGEGLVVKSKKMPGGNYVFAGFEKGLISLRNASVWGHSDTFGRYWFNTHGRLPPRWPRLAFPDLAWLWYGQGVGLDTIASKMVEIGRILEALVEKDLSFKDLREKLGVDSLTLAIDLSLLLTIKYVEPMSRNTWRLAIPVFMPEDYEVVRSVARAMLKDIANKLKTKMNRVREVYAKTSPAKNGVPLEEAFNPIYHIVFGQALDKLIAKGDITEPVERIDGGRYSAFLIILPNR